MRSGHTVPPSRRSRLIAAAMGASAAALATMPDEYSERIFAVQRGVELRSLLSSLDHVRPSRVVALGTTPLVQHSSARPAF